MKSESSVDISRQFERLMCGFFAHQTDGVIDRTDAEKKANKGMPDIEIKDKLYIECTVASKGDNNDGVTWEVSKSTSDRVMFAVPEEVTQARIQFAFQRIVTRLFEKQTQFEKNEKRLNKDLPMVVALTVNTDGLSHDYSYSDLYEDTFMKLLWDNGPGITIQMYLDGSSYEKPHKDCKKIKSQKKTELPAGIFNNTENNFKKISAILFIYPAAIKNSIGNGTPIGNKDMFLCINKFAEVPITEAIWKELLAPQILAEFPYTTNKKERR